MNRAFSALILLCGYFLGRCPRLRLKAAPVALTDPSRTAAAMGHLRALIGVNSRVSWASMSRLLDPSVSISVIRGQSFPCGEAGPCTRLRRAVARPAAPWATAKKLPECIDAELLKMWRHKVRRRRNHVRPCPRPRFRLAPPSGRWPSSWAVAQAPVCFR